MILVTGCTGLVGTSLLRRLLEDKRPVRGLVRHPDRLADPALGAVQWFRGDVCDLRTLAPAMEGVTQVVHLVGILQERGSHTFLRVHDQGTLNVVTAAKAAGVGRLLYVSALGTREQAKSRYHQSKWQAEQHVRQSGLDDTIFRPSVIFGPLDNFVNRFARILRYSPVAPLIGQGQNLLQPIWVEDVARCLMQALDMPETSGHTYDLGGPEQLSLATIMEEIADALGKRRLMLSIPLFSLKVQAALMERFLPVPPLTTDQLIMASEDNICDNREMMEVFKIIPRRFGEGIREYLRPD